MAFALISINLNRIFSLLGLKKEEYINALVLTLANIKKLTKFIILTIIINLKGHLLAVYKVKWNNFHPRTFISASADWTVKLWDSKNPAPIMSFDL